MSWRFRQSFKLIPGVRLNLSARGLSASIGGAPFTVNVSPRGVQATASIPGTGISFRERLPYETGGTPPASHLPQPVYPSASESQIHEIRSASTELMTSG